MLRYIAVTYHCVSLIVIDFLLLDATSNYTAAVASDNSYTHAALKLLSRSAILLSCEHALADTVHAPCTRTAAIHITER
jgi:hypothetical protein